MSKTVRRKAEWSMGHWPVPKWYKVMHKRIHKAKDKDTFRNGEYEKLASKGNYHDAYYYW